jgi:hypothetical protein
VLLAYLHAGISFVCFLGVRNMQLAALRAVVTHIAALNQIALLDAGRAARAAALPHALIIERFLPPTIQSLAPREVAAVLYLLAIYGRPVPPKLLRLVGAALPQCIARAQEAGIAPLWSGHRSCELPRLATIPQACFDALGGPDRGAPPQDVASCAWALARAHVHAPSAYESIAVEAAPLLVRRPPHQWPLSAAVPAASAPSGSCAWLTNDSVLRLAWALARAGPPAASAFAAALSEAVSHRVAWAQPTGASNASDASRGVPAFTFAQQALLVWAFAAMHHSDDVVGRLTADVLSPRALEAARPSLALGTQQLLHQAHVLLSRRAPPVPAAAAAALPPWLWQPEARAAAPRETDPHDKLFHAISVHLSHLKMPHVRQYQVDGFAVDIAFPAARFGIEVVHASLAHGTGGSSSGGGEGSGAASERRRGGREPAFAAAPAAANGGVLVRADVVMDAAGDVVPADARTTTPAVGVAVAVAAAPAPNAPSAAAAARLTDSGNGPVGVERVKREYLSAAGWQIVELDYALWRGMSTVERYRYLAQLTAGLQARAQPRRAAAPPSSSTRVRVRATGATSK